MKPTIVWGLLLALCVAATPMLGQKKLSGEEKRRNKQYLREQEKQLEGIFLHKTVVAKMSMPMTTDGVSTKWDKKKGEWVLNENLSDTRRYGVGVRAGDKYGITRIGVNPGGITFWLNDGGAIDTMTSIADSFSGFGNALQRMEHNQEMQRKQSAANGSRVHIFTYELPEVNDVVAIAQEQAATFFEIPDISSATETSHISLDKGTLLATTDPEGADIWIDGSFFGQAPAKLALPTGKHLIRVLLRGYDEWKRETEVGAGSEAKLNIQLVKTNQ